VDGCSEPTSPTIRIREKRTLDGIRKGLLPLANSANEQLGCANAKIEMTGSPLLTGLLV
jgi:hypothetical protein